MTTNTIELLNWLWKRPDSDNICSFTKCKDAIAKMLDANISLCPILFEFGFQNDVCFKREIICHQMHIKVIFEAFFFGHFKNVCSFLYQSEIFSKRKSKAHYCQNENQKHATRHCEKMLSIILLQIPRWILLSHCL